MKDWQEWIAGLDFRTNNKRRQAVIDYLNSIQVPHLIHKYETGKNIIVNFGEDKNKATITCHTDRHLSGGGANDNAAAMATCLGLIEYVSQNNSNQNIRFIFFDEEETDLIGSRAYVKEYGFKDISLLINLELVGTGDYMVLWPVYKTFNGATNYLYNYVTEALCANPKLKNNGSTIKIEGPPILLPVFPVYFSDELSFSEKGFNNSINFSRVNERDYLNARAYKDGTFEDSLVNLVMKSDTLLNYHNAEDNSRNISAEHIEANIRLLSEFIEYYESIKNHSN